MIDANDATCPRCRAPLPADAPADLCPPCLLSDTQGEKIEVPLVNLSFPQRANRMLALAVAVIGAILLGGRWLGQRQAASKRPLTTAPNWRGLLRAGEA